MPPQPVMNNLKVGGKLQGLLVGETTSSPNGSYAIRISHQAAITSSAFNGAVNMELWAAGNGYISQFGYSQAVGAGTRRANLMMRKLDKKDSSVSLSAAT